MIYSIKIFLKQQYVGILKKNIEKKLMKKHTNQVFIFTIFIVRNISQDIFEFTIINFNAVICDHLQYD